ncbi:hypothetical protein OBBRIDRAFT_798952 [Obba rivulosa]|uniref:Uncharacterized protein n=1 Tax=Obba rivulosa TaxID=1052685 RepID=A0A8E2AHJ1_9APHY|nr:hypothetical protein OBBRIDRAFT_798952 [Obba rivulosa]
MSDPENCSPSLDNQSKMSDSEDPVHSDVEVSHELEGSSEEDSSEEDWSEEGLSAEHSPEERHATAWVPPKLSPGDMEYTIRDIMSFADHRLNDKFILDVVTIARRTCPSPEDVLNNVNTATCFLLLVLQTAAPDIPLKPQWRNVDNLRAVAKQEILRESLANAVRCKVFIRMRSLGK